MTLREEILQKAKYLEDTGEYKVLFKDPHVYYCAVAGFSGRTYLSFEYNQSLSEILETLNNTIELYEKEREAEIKYENSDYKWIKDKHDGFDINRMFIGPGANKATKKIED